VKITKPTVVATEMALSKSLVKSLEGRRYVLLTDEHVTANCLPLLIDFLAVHQPLDIIEVEPGEASKSGEVAIQVWSHLLELGFNRHDVLLCFGGGSICDLGGFVAATYKRGIPVIFVPTTLLAMTDASIGGKNGIDVDGVKNAVGLIRMPERILVYPGFCETLSDEEFMSGFAEIVKHALLEGADLYAMVQDFDPEERLIPVALLRASIAVKHNVVRLDPLDQHKRLILNFGHTVGHALEAACLVGGKPLPHGIAIAFGLQVELRFSRLLKLLSPQEEERLQGFIWSLFEHYYPHLPEWGQIQLYLLNDKKLATGGLRIPVMEKPGMVGVIELNQLDLLQSAYSQMVIARN
jgi:3-dehydroquinate synthase